MNIFLWILQSLLAIFFLMAGLMKLTQSKEAQYERGMTYVEDFALPTIRLIGVLELLAVLGLILPAVTGILPWLTPLAAVGLMLTMVGAGLTHFRRKEFQPIAFNTFLFVLAAFVAYGRFVIIPFA